MLVLSRKVGQRIKIGEDVWVKLIESHKGLARIGVEAPRDVAVHREEVARSIECEMQSEKCKLQNEEERGEAA